MMSPGDEADSGLVEASAIAADDAPYLDARDRQGANGLIRANDIARVTRGST